MTAGRGAKYYKLMEQPQESARTQSGGLISGPCREAHWEELTEIGKIERLRVIVKRLERDLAVATRAGSEALSIATAHNHAPTGAVMVPAGLYKNSGAEIVRHRDEKYF